MENKKEDGKIKFNPSYKQRIKIFTLDENIDDKVNEFLNTHKKYVAIELIILPDKNWAILVYTDLS